MNRNELLSLDYHKKEELLKRLKPVQNWDKVDQGTYLFHRADNSIFNISIFERYDRENNIVYYCIDKSFMKEFNGNYEYHTLGWYYYDESIVDEVEELWTPKLWIVSNKDEDKDTLIVACNEQHLYRCFIEEHTDCSTDGYSYETFKQSFNYKLANEIDGFDIVVK